jgi:hypothetical protein
MFFLGKDSEMIQSNRLIAIAGILAILLGCSSESEKRPPSGASSDVAPPSVDLGGESAAPAAGETSGSGTASGETAKPAAGGWGTLSGRFVYDGAAPKQEPLAITKDAEFCGKHQPLNEELVVNSENGGIKNVVVMLYVKPRQKAPEAHPSYADKLNEPARLDNQNCRFEPHVLAMQTGQKLLIGNKDQVGHNTNAALSGQPFNELIGAEADDIQKTIDVAERLPAAISCNIHPWMRAYLVVTEHPYVAVTDENGEFKIENLPTGEWTFQIWQEKAAFIEDAERDGKTQKWDKGRTEFAINEGENDLGDIKVKPAIFE